MTGDLTRGKPLKLIVMFAVPLLIGNIFQQLYNMADTAIVGQTLGNSALAAVGSTGSVVFLVMGIIQGLTMGFAVITAQHFGSGDVQNVRKSVAASVLLSLIAGAVLTLVSVLGARPLLQLMRTPSDIIDDAVSYTVIIFAGSVALIFYNMFSNVLRSLGDSRTPLVFLIIACVINIGLDFLFIVPFQMGVAGAAYATIAAQFVSAVACLLYMRKKYKEYMPRKGDWKLTARSAFKHIRVGLPMSFQFIVIAVGIMVLQAALNDFGTDYIASYTAASKIDQLATQTLVSIGAAMATYTAQNYGAGQFGRIRQGVLCGLLLEMCFAVFGFLLMTFAGEYICLLFLDAGANAEVITNAGVFLKTVSIFYPVLGCIFLFRNIVQGMGNGIAPMVSGSLELVVRILCAVFLTAAWGYLGICYTGPFAWIAGAAVLMPSYFLIMRKLPKDNTARTDDADVVSRDSEQPDDSSETRQATEEIAAGQPEICDIPVPKVGDEDNP